MGYKSRITELIPCSSEDSYWKKCTKLHQSRLSRDVSIIASFKSSWPFFEASRSLRFRRPFMWISTKPITISHSRSSSSGKKFHWVKCSTNQFWNVFECSSINKTRESVFRLVKITPTRSRVCTCIVSTDSGILASESRDIKYRRCSCEGERNTGTILTKYFWHDLIFLSPSNNPTYTWNLPLNEEHTERTVLIKDKHFTPICVESQCIALLTGDPVFQIP